MRGRAREGDGGAGAGAAFASIDAGGIASSRGPHALHASAAEARAIVRARMPHYLTIVARLRSWLRVQLLFERGDCFLEHPAMGGRPRRGEIRARVYE